MGENDIKITKENFLKSNYEKIINSCETKECHKYSTKFLQMGHDLESSKDVLQSEIYILLGRLTFLNFRSESMIEPFAPMPSEPLDHAPEEFVQIFSSDDLILFANVVNEIEDAEFRARISDVLWILKRDYKMAELAIDSYLESATILEHPRHWTQCEERIQRAFRLSNMLGKKNNNLNKVIQHIERVLDKYDGEDPLYLSHKMMSLLVEAKQGDSQKYSNLSEKCANIAEEEKSFRRARAYWEIKADWDKIQKDEEQVRESRLKHAESYVKEAEYRIKSPNKSYLAASTFLQRAIEAYRKIPGTKDIADKIHEKLIEYERESLKEMQTISTEYDISEHVKNTISKISGKSLIDALSTLSLMINSPKVSDLRKEVKESAGKYILQHLVSEVAVNKDGKVVARKESMYSENPDQVEEAIKQNMHQHADFHRRIIVQSIIEPARHQINLEHNVSLSDCMNIVTDNPFVPPGRENLFAQGLLSGFLGKYAIAAHLLIPQIENTLRFILVQKGVIASGLDSNGIQDERSLNTTLYTKEIESVFGKDLVFDLQGLLAEKIGANLRNRMAHGLMDSSSFYSIHVSYLWALTLRLCLWPILIKKYPPTEN